MNILKSLNSTLDLKESILWYVNYILLFKKEKKHLENLKL